MANLKPTKLSAAMRSWIACAITFWVHFVHREAAMAQQLDDSCTVTVNRQTVQVNPDGTFVVPNVAAADLFGAGGPGTPPDFLSDDFLRLTGQCVGPAGPTYVTSECFRLRRGESFQLGTLTFSATPFPGISSITAVPVAPTLTTLGQQTAIALTGRFSDGSTGPINSTVFCPATFRTSNASVVSVSAAPGNPHQGIAVARAAGTALITASVEGAISATSITVSLGDPLTTVTGIVQTAEGDPVDGAVVRFLVNGVVISGSGVTGGPGQAPGQFTVTGVASQLGQIVTYVEATFDGTTHSGVGPSKPPVPGGFTDAGLITLDDRVIWITNGNGLWQTGSNWISGAPPTANQIAVIDVPLPITVTYSAGNSVVKGVQCAETLVLSGGSLTIEGDARLDGTFTLSGGTLGGSGRLTLAGPLNWTNGTMTGTGTTVVAPTGSLTISGTSNKTLSRTLENHSPNATWTGGHLLFGNGTLSNESDGVFTAALTADVSFSHQFGTTLFRNAGTFTQAGPATASSTVQFNNTGDVHVQAGTLQLNGGGINDGRFEVDPTSTLSFAGTHTHATGTSLTGAGTVTFTSGTHTFAAGTFNPTGPVNFSGGVVTVNNTFSLAGPATIAGTLNCNAVQSFSGLTLTGTLGGSGQVTVTGPLNWTNGTMSGTGTTVVASTGSLTISGTSNKTLNRTLENHSPNATWTGGHILFGGGTLSNESDGAFTAALTADVSFSHQFGTTLFRNAGTFIQAGPRMVSITVPFNNTGDVHVQVGTLLVQNNGTSSGDFEVGPGTTVNFTSTYTHDALSVLTNHGTLGLGGTNNFAGVLTSDGIINLTGTANFNADYALSGSVNLSGTLGGTGRITLAGPLNWTNGTMTGTGTTVVAPTGSLTISGTSNKTLSRTLENHSPNATWTGGHILFGNGTLSNESDGVFTAALTADVSFSHQFGTTLFRNAGTFTQAGPATASSTVQFNNTGDVHVQAGTLVLVGAYTQTDTRTVLAGGTITKSGGVIQINGGTIGLGPGTAAGTITGSVTLGNAAASTVPRPGGAGTLTISSAYTQTAGTLDIELAGTTPGTDFDQLVVSGTATLGGTLRLSLINGFVPSVGQQFQVVSAGSRSGTFSTVLPIGFPGGVGASVAYSATGATVTITSP